MTGPMPLLENVHHENFTNENINSPEKWCKLSDIPVHGDTLTGKANNTIRILFENVDGFVVPDKTGKKRIKININNCT